MSVRCPRKEQEQLGRGFLAIDPIVANLDESRLSRYIRVSIVLSVEDGQKEPALTALTEINPKIKDWVYGFLSGKTLDDVRGQDNQQKLRVEIQAGINSQLKAAGYPEFAKAVLFDEINVQ
ncbi:MAG: flagellar basal body-associated FliL family protein [Planctomycetaceae bacterium]